MDDEEEEMARLRQSKKHQAFETKYDRAGARMIKQLHLQQSNQSPSPSPSPPSKATPTIQKPNNKKRKVIQIDDDNTPHVITEEEIKNLPTSFGKKHSLKSNKPKDTKTKVDFSQEFKSDDSPNNNSNTKNQNKKDKIFKKTTKKYFEHVLSEYKMPLKYVAKLKGHHKLVSTMSIDRSGTRLITGSYDNTIKLWDFGGMNSKLESFRSITPVDGYPVKQLSYNYSGSIFLCITTSHQPIIYDRDGKLLYSQYKSGDMYIRDMNHTFGHTMPLMGGEWFGYNSHNANMNEFCTWSQDSTFRIWDINSNNGHCKQIIKARNKSGKRISISCADTSCSKVANFNNSFLIMIGCNDGSIQIFDHKSHCKRPKKIINNAHLNGSDISDILIDANYFLSRGGMNDNTLKIWDIRNMSGGEPVKTFSDMWNITSLSNVIKSPNSNNNNNKSSYITTCSNRKDSKIGKSCLCLIDSATFVEMIRIPVSDKAINCVLWHNKINQLFIGGNDCNVRVYYEDEGISSNGVLLCAKRKYKKKHIDQQVKYFEIINPNAIKVYKRHSQILSDKRKKDLTLHKPEMPHYGIGVQGRINTESFTHNVYKSQEKNIMSQVDPRDRLLLFQDKAEQNQEFTAIYNINQPKPVFQEKNEQELEANNIVSKLYSDMPGARQYIQQPPKKKQKT